MPKSIVLGVSASIAIYKSCELTRELKEEGFEVSVILTPEAEELIRPIVFQALSGRRVYTGLFGQPRAWEIEHISLADKADLVLVAPATANIIAKISSGICDDLLTCVISATKAPVLIAPAMNENMYLNKITQENIRKLKGYGYKFAEPKRGRLACGKEGIGCLADIKEIIQQAKKILK